ncbi:hypothetical protein [Gilvimarinus algae]|uniref:DUF1330 domain-containing protein n=1 Tax=Gilvimarinus algae TaxID=3058037 RepID=A0ABT8TII3_9GAMM|nr:hypothetical protein [Gilvimarinus sp. SDUM040014]MDO3383850.1 hypothetical protein [Gilvimarinus sp. SDUM040014]
MNQVLNVELYGASMADVDGRQYASLYIGQKVEDEKEEGAKGIVIMKMPCDPDVYHALNAPKYPAQVQAHVRLKKAAGGKLGQHCVKIAPAPSAAPSAPSK